MALLTPCFGGCYPTQSLSSVDEQESVELCLPQAGASAVVARASGTGLYTEAGEGAL